MPGKNGSISKSVRGKERVPPPTGLRRDVHADTPDLAHEGGRSPAPVQGGLVTQGRGEREGLRSPDSQKEKRWRLRSEAPRREVGEKKWPSLAVKRVSLWRRRRKPRNPVWGAVTGKGFNFRGKVFYARMRERVGPVDRPEKTVDLTGGGGAVLL